MKLTTNQLLGKRKEDRMLRATCLAILTAGATMAQAPPAGPVLTLTATTDNVAGAPDNIRISVHRWSTDAEREQLLSAWNMTAPPPTAGRGAARGGADQTADPSAADAGDAAPVAAPAAGGRGGRGGGGRGNAAAAADPRPPAPPAQQHPRELAAQRRRPRSWWWWTRRRGTWRWWRRRTRWWTRRWRGSGAADPGKLARRSAG